MKVGDIRHEKDGDYKLLEYKEYPRVDNDGKPVTPVTEETWAKVSTKEKST